MAAMVGSLLQWVLCGHHIGLYRSVLALVFLVVSVMGCP